MGKKVEPKEHVELAPKLPDMSSENLHEKCWAPASAIDWLATQRKKESNKGVAHPHVYSDLDRWAPSWCSQQQLAREDSDEEEDSMSKGCQARALPLRLHL